MGFSSRIDRLVHRVLIYQVFTSGAVLVSVGVTKMVRRGTWSVDADVCECGGFRGRLIDHEGMEIFSVHLGPCWSDDDGGGEELEEEPSEVEAHVRPLHVGEA